MGKVVVTAVTGGHKVFTVNKDCVGVTDVKQEVFRFPALRSARFRVDEDVKEPWRRRELCGLMIINTTYHYIWMTDYNPDEFLLSFAFVWA